MKYVWKLSRNESTEKVNFFVTCTDGLVSGTGEVAPNIRYQETPELVLKQFSSFVESKQADPSDLVGFSQDLSHFDFCNSLRFGIESSLFHYKAVKENTTVASLLKIPEPPASVQTCYTIPVMDPGDIPAFFKTNLLDRFKILKVKVHHHSALDTIETISKLTNAPLIIDANESWTNLQQFLAFSRLLTDYKIEFIEQPFPSDMEEAYINLKKVCPYPVFADESVLHKPNFDHISQQFHGINVKLMKAGGYINAKNQMIEAKRRGLKTMIGCMVESSLGISSAMNLASQADYADLDGSFIISNEPYGLILEENGCLKLKIN